MKFLNRNPKCTITVHTWRGETFDLTKDFAVWTTQKSLTQPQGSFVIQLSANNNWDTKIKPMDYVEIRASAQGKTVNGQYPIIMRGFVDYSGRSFSIGPVGGPNEPRITIQGRDYSKLLLDWQVLYLWTQNDQAEMAAAQQGYGLINLGIPLINSSLQSFFDIAFSKLIAPIVQGLKSAWLLNIPDFQSITNLPDYEMVIANVASYTGSYWNFLSYFSSPPFGELFIRDEEDHTEMVARVSPYKTIDGKTPAPGTNLLYSIFVETLEIQGFDIGYTDNDVFTYYLTFGDVMNPDASMAYFASSDKNGVIKNDQGLYGIRPLIIDTPWINTLSAVDKTNGNATSIADTLNQWLMDVMKDNASLRFGSMEMAGHEKYKIGEYMHIKDWNQEYYVSSASHTFTQFGRWDTQVGVVRGRNINS